MKHASWLVMASVAAVALLFGATAHAKINKERGNVVSTNWNRMEIDIKDPQGRVGTWHVKRDCRLRFSDQKDSFPNPKLSDLKAPMYLHFMFEEGTDLIQDIEVREVGFNAAKGGAGVEQKGVVAATDEGKGHLAIVLDPGGQTTFRVDPKEMLEGLEQGDEVTILVDTRDGRKVVTRITREGATTSGAARRPPRP